MHVSTTNKPDRQALLTGGFILVPPIMWVGDLGTEKSSTLPKSTWLVPRLL